MDVFGSGMPHRLRPWAVVALACLVAPHAAGCKTGTAGMRPSGWPFGGGPQSDADTLATAPTFKADVEKPSATAKPYPTTSAPDAYVLSDPARSAVSVGGTTAPQAPAAVTYGTTPPPASANPASVATAPPAGPAAGGSLSAIAPQVGPYGGLAAETPSSASAADLPPLRSIAGPSAGVGGVAATQPSEPAPPQRVADARGGSAWPAQPAAAPAGGGRYDTATGSRFGGVNAMDQSYPAPSAHGLAPSAAAGPPTTPEAWTPPPLPAPAPAMPAAPVTPPMAPAAGSSPLTPPDTNPGQFVPPAALPPPVSPAPTRRPDPGYRPGGTSSYRPNREVLAAEPPPAESSGVKTAGFEMPVP